MKRVLILGGGTGGTMLANKLARELDEGWTISLVDKEQTHYYQPGFLFIPFGVYGLDDVERPRRQLIDKRVELLFSDIERIDPEAQTVHLERLNSPLPYDILVVATGAEIRADQVAGLQDAWRENAFDFYTPSGALALHERLENWEGGRLVVNVAEMPIKCPVAPLEFLFLADWYFHQRGIRDKVELVYATPLPGAFTKPQASRMLGDMLARKGIQVEVDFNVGEVDGGRSLIRSWDEREVAFDLLVSIPTNMGAQVIERSGMGDELNFVRTDKHTLQARDWENVWVIGDAANVPASKAGSTAHFMLDVVAENILRQIEGLEPKPDFDGHANCFIETGFDRGVMIDFNYEVEPLPGKYPLPGVGPFSLLEESRINHLGKLSFKWIYWNILLPGRAMPVSNQLSMAGKAN